MARKHALGPIVSNAKRGFWIYFSCSITLPPHLMKANQRTLSMYHSESPQRKVIDVSLIEVTKKSQLAGREFLD